MPRKRALKFALLQWSLLLVFTKMALHPVWSTLDLCFLYVDSIAHDHFYLHKTTVLNFKILNINVPVKTSMRESNESNDGCAPLGQCKAIVTPRECRVPRRTRSNSPEW